MIAVRGAGSAIAQALKPLIGKDRWLTVSRPNPMPLNASRYLFCNGVLVGKPLSEQSPAELGETYEANYWSVVRECERVLAHNAKARICVLGSESGFAGSYDGAYASAKARLHAYVEHRRLKPDQQLICIAPSIVADAGMTTRRKDTENLKARTAAHPKKRLLAAKEVAKLIHFALYVDQGYLTNTVIRLNGGAHAA